MKKTYALWCYYIWLALFIGSDAYSILKRHAFRLRSSLRMMEDKLLRTPFVIDIKTKKMVMGPDITALPSISKAKRDELSRYRSNTDAERKEIVVEELDMETVTRKWTAYCKAMNKPIDVKDFDIRDVIAACMKPNTFSQIVDEEESPEDVPLIFVTDRELRRLFVDRTKSNLPMTKQDILDSLLAISDEDDMKFESNLDESSDSSENNERLKKLEEIKPTEVPARKFFYGDSDGSDVSYEGCTQRVKVYDVIIASDRAEIITLPELLRAWEIRVEAGWGLPAANQFDPKTALLLLSEGDDEEDMELVDGPVEYVMAKDIPQTKPYLASLTSVGSDKLREYLRRQISNIDDDSYTFNYPPLSPISPNVESQRLSVENFMHSKNPLYNRLPANWDDPEQNDWEDSDMYTATSKLAYPGEPLTDFNIKEPVWKQLGFSAEEIYPNSGRYLEYIVREIDDIEQLILPPIVEWSIRLHAKRAKNGIQGFEDIPQTRLSRGMLGGETDKDIFADIAKDAEHLSENAAKDILKYVEEAKAKDVSLTALTPDEKVLDELRSSVILSPKEEAELDRTIAMDDTASYFDDLEIAMYDLEDKVNVEVMHPESEWMKFQTSMERSLDKLEKIQDITEDDILEHLEDEEAEDEDFNLILRDLQDALPHVSNDSCTNPIDDDALNEFHSTIGSDEHMEARINDIAQEALTEIEAWVGSKDDYTNVLHPKVLKPVFKFSDRVEAFKLRFLQRQAKLKRAAILAEAESEGDDDVKLPKIPTEADMYENDLEYMEDMKFFRELINYPEYEQAMDEMDAEIREAWKKFWAQEKSIMLQSLKQGLREGPELEGRRPWERKVNQAKQFLASYDVDDEEEDDRSDSEADEEENDGTSFKFDSFDPVEYGRLEIMDLVAKDREHGIHEPNDTYPSRYNPAAFLKRFKEVEMSLEQMTPSIDALHAEYESLKTDFQEVVENLADYQLPHADLESQDLAYDFDGRRIPEIETEMTNDLGYVPWMDVYYWEKNRERWSQGYYEDGAFRTPPAWLLRPEYEDMVGYEVWSNYDRRLFFDWDDHMLDDDAYTVASAKVLKDITDMYLTSHVQVANQLGKYNGWRRFISAKLRNASVTFPVKQDIPKSWTPDLDRGIEYTDEIFELKHGKKLGKKLPPLEERFQNDTFTLCNDTLADNEIGTIQENYYWKPLQNITRHVEPSKEAVLKPLIDFINHMGKLVSTKDDVIIFDYFGPMKHILGLQGSMEYMAKQLYPATKELRLETERDFDANSLVTR